MKLGCQLTWQSHDFLFGPVRVDGNFGDYDPDAGAAIASPAGVYRQFCDHLADGISFRQNQQN
jgi:hypothetical protein